MVEFGDVRSLFQLPPSPQTWAQLCAWVERSEGDELEHVVLPYMQQQLNRWPARMRTAPHSWLERMMQDSKVRQPQMALVSTLDMRGFAPSKASWRDERAEDLSWVLRRSELESIRHILMNRVAPHNAELTAMVSNPALRGLESIDLGECPPGESDARALLEADEMARLEEVSWSASKLDDLFAKRLSASALGARIKRLDISQNALTHEGLAALMGAGRMARLVSLTASKNEVNGELLGKLLAGDAAPALRELTLAQLALGGALAGVLPAALAARLERLDLWRTGLVERDVKVLCGLPLGALRALELSKNAVGDGGAEALASCAALRELEELALFDAQLGDAGALALVKAAGTTLPKLWKINLLGNKLSPMALGELDAIAAERELSLKLP